VERSPIERGWRTCGWSAPAARRASVRRPAMPTASKTHPAIADSEAPSGGPVAATPDAAACVRRPGGAPSEASQVGLRTRRELVPVRWQRRPRRPRAPARDRRAKPGCAPGGKGLKVAELAATWNQRSFSTSRDRRATPGCAPGSPAGFAPDSHLIYA
jgi:hypothetical protein